MNSQKSDTHRTQSGLSKLLDPIANLLVKVSIVLGSLVALGMIINVFLDVALRFGFNSPIQGTNQFVSYWWMLPLVFFGLAVAQRYGEHTDLPIVFERLNLKGKQAMAIVALSCTAIFVLIIGWAGLTNALDQMAVGEYDSSTGVTVWPPRFAIPVACLAFLCILLAEIFKLITNKGEALAEEEIHGEEADVIADLEAQNIIHDDAQPTVPQQSSTTGSTQERTIHS